MLSQHTKLRGTKSKSCLVQQSRCQMQYLNQYETARYGLEDVKHVIMNIHYLVS